MTVELLTETTTPLAQLREWFAAAQEALGAEQATAMALATVGSDGTPDVRFVLCKGFDEQSGTIRFFTNLGSAKAQQIAAHSSAAVSFWWPNLQRQVRIRGTVQELSRETVTTYFATRDRNSQLSAWASRQSQPVASRSDLEQQVAAAAESFSHDVTTPEWWGGYSISIDELEFWQGQPGRLHDRLLYTREERGEWLCNRLQP